MPAVEVDPLKQELVTRMYRLVKRPEWLEVRRGNDELLCVIEGAEIAAHIFGKIYREHLIGRSDAFISGLVLGASLIEQKGT